MRGGDRDFSGWVGGGLGPINPPEDGTLFVEATRLWAKACTNFQR